MTATARSQAEEDRSRAPVVVANTEDPYPSLPSASSTIADQPTVTDANEPVTHRSWLRPIDFRSYGLAIVSVGVALGTSLVLQHFGFRVPAGLLMLFAVAISSWYGGPRPAVLAVILSALSLLWYFVEPVRTIHIYRSEIPYVVTYIALAVVLSWFGRLRRRVETELRSSETYLTQAESISHTGSWAWNPASGVQYWSQECYRIMGFDPAEGVPRLERFLERVHPEDLPRLRQRLRRVAREKTDYDDQYRIIRPSGEIRDLHVIAHPVFDSAGNLVEYVGTTADVTERKRAEDDLQRNEGYLAEGQRLAHTGSWALDVRGEKYVYFSKECLRMYGFDPEGPLPSREAVFRRIHPEDRERVERSFQKSVHEKVDASDELRIVLPDGTIRHFHVIRHPVLNSAGGVVQLVGTSIDITERKTAEEALRDSETKLRREQSILTEAERLSHTGAWEWDVASGTWSFSDEWLRIHGTNRRTLSSEELILIAHPEDRQSILQAFEGVRKGEKPYNIEHRIIQQGTGEVRVVRASGTFLRDEDGRVTKVYGCAQDITEQKRAEVELRDGETRFRTFIDHATDAFFMLDFEKVIIIDVNQPACDSLGYTREELIGKTPLAFDMNLDRATLKSIAERTAAGETVLFERHWHRRKDGSTFPVEVHTSVFWHSGRRLLLKVARDITDRLRAEQDRDKLRQLEADLAHLDRVSMLGEMAASIAHEVNQPLSGIVSNASASLRFLSADTPDVEEAREAARDIVRDGKRAGEIIARIRALTRRAEAPRVTLDMNEMIREVLDLIGDEPKKHNVTIRTEFAHDCFPIVGDRVQLQQVMLNLVMNGMEAMSNVGKWGRELTITTRNVDVDHVQITVKDSGVGLDPKAMPDIFKPFYTTKPTGMGMGLSICRSIVQAHEGKLWATANDGPGASFHFTLPKYQAEADARLAG